MPLFKVLPILKFIVQDGGKGFTGPRPHQKKHPPINTIIYPLRFMVVGCISLNRPQIKRFNYLSPTTIAKNRINNMVVCWLKDCSLIASALYIQQPTTIQPTIFVSRFY